VAPELVGRRPTYNLPMSSGRRARVITCSDKASRGERIDESGPALRQKLIDLGFETDDVVVVPDDFSMIVGALESAVDDELIDLIVTTGGTGVAPRDVTPEATMRVADRVIPGFGELMRARSGEKTRMAPLSRAQAVSRGRSLILNVPGSPKGAVENLEFVAHLIPHVLDLLSGENTEHDPHRRHDGGES